MVFLNDQAVTPQRVFCIGRNYAAHAAELGNPLPDAPVVFMKPPSALIPPDSIVPLPRTGGNLHFETELVLLIGRSGYCNHESEAPSFISGLGLGFDLTLRELQEKLKSKQLPWERAKSFDFSAPVSRFVEFAPARHPLTALTFEGLINGQVRQSGDTALLLYTIPRLLVEISAGWKLCPGDLIFTGTPAGVGVLEPGDTLCVRSPWYGQSQWRVTPGDH